MLAGFEIAVDDPLFVRVVQRIRDLPGDGQGVLQVRARRGRAPAEVTDQFGQVSSVDQFHHQRAQTTRFLEAVDVSDVWMIERRQRLRFAREPREPFGIAHERGRQDLQRDVAIELRVVGTVDLAHSAGAEQRDDFIWAEGRAGS